MRQLRAYPFCRNDDVVRLPCLAELDQVGMLAAAVSDLFKTTQNPFSTKDT